MAKIFGGGASRLEVYALFVAAVVLIGGGIGGAIVVSSNDASRPQVAVAETSTSTMVLETVPSATEPVVNEVPPTLSQQQPSTARAPQPVPTTPPTPTTTICIPDQNRLAQLQTDRETELGSGGARRLEEIFESHVPAFGIEITRVAKANTAEYQRALGALQACQVTSWRFERYPNGEDYRTPTSTWWGTN